MSDYLKQQIEVIDKKIKDAQDLAASDSTMVSLAEEEIKQLQGEKDQLEKALIREPQATSQPVSNSVILEIRAAAGGDEAGLFAGDLARMDTKYAATQNWRV